jgi:hypothetical protein
MLHEYASLSSTSSFRNWHPRPLKYSLSFVYDKVARFLKIGNDNRTTVSTPVLIIFELGARRRSKRLEKSRNFHVETLRFSQSSLVELYLRLDSVSALFENARWSAIGGIQWLSQTYKPLRIGHSRQVCDSHCRVFCLFQHLLCNIRATTIWAAPVVEGSA